jgi:pyruvate/2-oxoglutarate dehydrogenase complex dihydrolipoamide acyltransferase (E2) component
MARRSAAPPKPKSPILTIGQKRGRIERLHKCVTSLETFDPQKARKRAPAVLALEAAIDKALSSAFGYGTPAYLRYNQAATLDPSPLLANATLRSPVLRPVGGPARQEAKAQEARQHFSENKERSISLLRKAISTLEEEIADAEPVVTAVQKSKATPLIDAEQESKATQKPEVRTLQPRRWGGIALKAAWRRLGRWWRGRKMN